jgi:hypothetical protein
VTDTQVLLGYGDGSVQLVDYRKFGVLASGTDANSRAIGDIKLLGPYFITFGQDQCVVQLTPFIPCWPKALAD